MQPTQHSPLSVNTNLATSPRRRRTRAALAAGALVAGVVLAACGGSSDEASSDGAAADATTTAAQDSGAGDVTTTAAGAAEVDVCAEITLDEMAAILTEADLTGATANEAFTVPNCGYTIDIGGGGTAMAADVVSIRWNDPSFFDGQKELQTDEVDLTDIGADAFAIDDGGMILVRGASGTWEITRGVELAEGGQPASDDQMAAIAQLVAGL